MRGQEKAIVQQARAAGQLAHAGDVAPEEEMKYAQAHPSTSTLTRAEVKEQVLEARANGTLIPAGEGEFSNAGPVTTTTFAKARPAADQNVASRGK